MNNFQIQLNRLPKDVRDMLTSMKATELNLFISEKYQIKDENIKKLSHLISLLYFKGISLDSLVSEIARVFSFDEEKSKNMAIDIVGIRLLVVDKWLDGKPSVFLKKNGVDISKFQSYIDEQKKAITEEEEFFKEQFKEDIYVPPKPKKKEFTGDLRIDYNKEKQESINIFKESLKNILVNYEKLEIDDYNSILVIAIAEDLLFRDNLLKSLFENNEKLTSAEFVLGEELHSPSIKNWLNDFSKSSSSRIDNLSIVNYLVNSPNAKKISDEEKKYLKRLLYLYANLKNFDKNDIKIPLEKWRVLPEKNSDFKSLSKIHKEVAQPKTLTPQIPKPQSVDSISSVKKTNATRLPRVDELRAMADKYPAGSLERKAIEEEIKRIERGN